MIDGHKYQLADVIDGYKQHKKNVIGSLEYITLSCIFDCCSRK